MTDEKGNMRLSQSVAPERSELRYMLIVQLKTADRYISSTSGDTIWSNSIQENISEDTRGKVFLKILHVYVPSSHVGI